jgi:hypothetical protein
MRSVAILALLVSVVHAEPAKRGGKKPPGPPDAGAQLEAQGYAKFRVRMQATCTTSPTAGAQAEQITAHASLEVVQYGRGSGGSELFLAPEPVVSRTVTGSWKGHSEEHDSEQDVVVDSEGAVDRSLFEAVTFEKTRGSPSQFTLKLGVAFQVTTHARGSALNLETPRRRVPVDQTTTATEWCPEVAPAPDARVPLRRIAKGYTLDWDQDNGRYREHATITIEPADEPLYDAVFEPDADYPSWVPMGDLAGRDVAADPAGRRGSVGFKVSVVDHKTHQPVALPHTLHVHLDGVSAQPGVAMNFPRQADADTRPDLYLAAADNPGARLGDEVTLDLSSTGAPVHVVVRSRDFGAYGRATATVQLASGGDPFTASFRGEPHLALPLDVDGNHIADAWQKQHGAMTRPAIADDEAAPSGWFNPGDGFDLYEEYRGVVVVDGATGETGCNARPAPKRRWIELDPGKRELLFAIERGVSYARRPEGDPAPFRPDLMRLGVQHYAEAAQIALHEVALCDLASPANEAGGVNLSQPAWVNFNAHPDDGVDFGPKQAAVVIWSGSVLHNDPRELASPRPPTVIRRAGARDFALVNAPGTTLRVKRDTGSLSPMRVVKVMVSLVNAESAVDDVIRSLDPADPRSRRWGAAAADAADLARLRATALDPDKPPLSERLFVSAISHELGHATGAQHHTDTEDAALMASGDRGCPMRYWQVTTGGAPDLWVAPDDIRAFLDRTWDPSQIAPNRAAWRFCDAPNRDRGKLRLHD